MFKEMMKGVSMKFFSQKVMRGKFLQAHVMQENTNLP